MPYRISDALHSWRGWLEAEEFSFWIIQVSHSTLLVAFEFGNDVRRGILERGFGLGSWIETWPNGFQRCAELLAACVLVGTNELPMEWLERSSSSGSSLPSRNPLSSIATDLPLNCHPAAIRASTVFVTPCGAG